MASISVEKNLNGTDSYKVSIRKKGLPEIYKRFSNRKEAEEFAIKYEALDTSAPNNMIFPFKIYIERYRKECAVNSKTNFVLNFWETTLGNKIATEITDRDIEFCIHTIINSTTKYGTPPCPETVRKYIVVISSIFTHAIKNWKWCSENPASKVRRLFKKPTVHKEPTKNQLILNFKKELKDVIEQKLLGMGSHARAMKLGISGKSTYNYLFDSTRNTTISLLVNLLEKINMKLQIVPLDTTKTEDINLRLEE